jgi:lysophospholipase L1-like esterase
MVGEGPVTDTKLNHSDDTPVSNSADQIAVERREFLKRGAMALGAGCLTIGGARELLAATKAISARAYVTTPAGAAIDPFRTAVIGDSVMWGQGLRDENKLHSKLLSYVTPRLNGRPVEKQHVAHSGAIIGVKEAVSSSADWASRGVSGEVPSKYPTIAYQAANQVTSPELVDLLVMDGGINDVTVDRILTMDYMISLDNLRLATRDMLGMPMEWLLADIVMPRFPKATIVVTNYFPIVSYESDPIAIAALMTALFGLVGLAVTYEVRRKLADQALTFHAESTTALRNAVARANQRHGTQRVLFVETGFGPSNSVGAPSAWLYNPGQPDEAQPARIAECDRWKSLIGGGYEACKVAGLGHPNPSGASVYAAKILSAINPLLPGWAAPSTAPVVPTMAITTAAGTASLTSRSITVFAKDAKTGTPLNGTVRINGATGVTGQPLSYSPCYTTETFEGPLGKPVTRKINTPCAGTVSVSGYADAEFSG